MMRKLPNKAILAATLRGSGFFNREIKEFKEISELFLKFPKLLNFLNYHSKKRYRPNAVGTLLKNLYSEKL